MFRIKFQLNRDLILPLLGLTLRVKPTMETRKISGLFFLTLCLNQHGKDKKLTFFGFNFYTYMVHLVLRQIIVLRTKFSLKHFKKLHSKILIKSFLFNKKLSFIASAKSKTKINN